MKLLLILGISILYYQIAHSEYIYKYSVDTVYRYNGGKLITIFDKDLFVNYYFQNDFGSATFSISKWYGLEKKGAKGISRNNYNGIDYLVCESRVVVLLNDDEFIKLAIFDNNLNLLYEIVVDGLTKKTNLDNYRIFKLADRVLIKSNQKILFHSLDLKKNIDSLELTSDENIFPMDSSYLILKTSNSTGLITMYDYKNKAFGRNNLIIYDTVSVKKINDLVFISTSSTNSIQTLLQVINYKTGQIELLKWLDSEINNVDFTVIDNTFYLTYVKQTFSANKLIVEKFTNIRHIPDIATTLFPSALIEPQNTKFIQNKIITLLKNGIFGTYLDGTIILSEQFHASELEQINSFNSDRLNYLILSGTNRNELLTLKENNYRVFSKIWIVLKEFGLIITLLLIIMALIQTLRHKSRVFNEILKHPALGNIYFIDPKGRLKLANNEGGKYLNLNPNVPMNKQFRYYCLTDFNNLMADIIDRTLSEKENVTERISLKENGVIKEWICKTFIIKNIAGFTRGIVLSGIDITEQLERQRLSNLAQLAHDMQTNLSTIKLNAEQFELVEHLDNYKRKQKILFQVNLLIQRVRDILAVGRDDIVELEDTSACELLQSVMMEFDESLFPDVEFKIECGEITVICDKKKLIRALRNAVENALKYLPDRKGKIILKAIIENNNYIYSVRDNGKGMDADTKVRMLIPYFTTAKKSGGSGIGTMIMQKVAELHNGKINVESEPGKGTEVQFIFPIQSLKLYKKYKGRYDK